MILKGKTVVKVPRRKYWRIVAGMDSDRLVALVAELKSAYVGFTWESELWTRVGCRRSPYRTLVLFGLSARTRDALLVEMCRELFRRIPTADALAQAGELAGDAVGDIVRPGQIPFVLSAARVLGNGVPERREGLLGIRGVGDKIAECVLAYGWGEEALPLDANCVRVLQRVFGLEHEDRNPAALRQELKSVYLKKTTDFASLSVGMVDIHEILRLHGQTCCARTPICRQCPATGCLSRREPWDQSAEMELDQSIWDDWRELINEPAAV